MSDRLNEIGNKGTAHGCEKLEPNAKRGPGGRQKAAASNINEKLAIGRFTCHVQKYVTDPAF
jgi:hypothetical protein